jgi:glycerol-3-phosphate dehydrogenase (NAD(P)+)
MQVAIIGGGNFGTAIANIIAANGHTTYLWMRDVQQAQEVARLRENKRYLPGHTLAPGIIPTADLAMAAEYATLLFVTVPSQSFGEVCGQVAPFVQPENVLISGTKGIDAEGFRLMSQLLEDLTPSQRVGVLSGPNLAEEIADGQYTGTVVASADTSACEMVQEVMRNDRLRVYVSSDLYGVELGGALKNIYAIICGMAAGLDVGQNTVGMLITRALAEMSRFAVSMGGNPFTFLGLSGVGDLLVTCSSPLSRNYQLGFKMAKGMSLDAAADALGKLAEGVNTLKVVRAKKDELNVYMPLVEGLYQLLFEQRDMAEIIEVLMSAHEGMDVEFADPQYWRANGALTER